MAADEATWQFVDEHLKEDVHQLALQKHKFNDIDFDFAIQQIQGRQKTRDKLPVLASIPRFIFPPTLSLEQCSSEITAHFKASLVGEYKTQNQSMADLTGGFGIDTLFFSDVFQTCHYVEPQTLLCDILKQNIQVLGKQNIIVHQDTMEHFLEEMPTVDFLYLDPSRRDTQGKKVVTLEDCSPNVLLFKNIILDKANKVMLKLSPMLDIKRALTQLAETSDVYVVAVNGECKELLFVMDSHASTPLTYHAINLTSHNGKWEAICFEFTGEEEQDALPQFSSMVETYLYEPNAAVLKAGAFKCVATSLQLKKLHPHTHLYTSDVFREDFPGRIFSVQQTFSLKEAKSVLKILKKANVAVRNFPLTAEQLRQNLKLADGGEVYIFGMTLADGKKFVVTCTKENIGKFDKNQLS